jgi:hypothetical protein
MSLIHSDDMPKSYRLWHVEGHNEFVAAVAEADSFKEIRQVSRRPDWRYQITCAGRPLDDTGFPILEERRRERH